MLRVDFDGPTDLFELSAVMPEWSLDGGVLSAFNSSGQHLVDCWVGGNGSMGRPSMGSTLGPCGEIEVIYGDECPLPSGYRVYCNRVVTARIARPTADMAYVLWGGLSETATPVYVDRVSYNVPVPEPASAALLAAGLLGLAGFRRRARR